LNEKAVPASLNKFLRETDEYQEMLKDWEQDQQDNNETPPEPTRIIGALVMRALGVTFPNPDRVTVRLKLPGEPAITNGNWNPDSRQVEWSKAVLPHAATLPEFPVLLHAVWSEPHAERQNKVFGRVLLKGRPLVEYCLWFEGLSQAEAKEWEDFLSTLNPGDDFEAQLKAFHFENAEANLTDIPRRIFKSARESQKG